MTTTSSTGTQPTDLASHDALAARTKVLPPINIHAWVEANRDKLRPPVGNQYLYDGEDFFVMVVGGPNARNDFHCTNSEEYFFQLEGDICVRIIEDGAIRNVRIREGETFFIPGGVPHSPQRPPNTIGLVVERRRPPGETEHLQFYDEQTGALVFDQEFDCADIVEHFRDAMEAFWADPELSTCKQTGVRITKPTPIERIVWEPEFRIERE